MTFAWFQLKTYGCKDNLRFRGISKSKIYVAQAEISKHDQLWLTPAVANQRSAADFDRQLLYLRWGLGLLKLITPPSWKVNSDGLSFRACHNLL